MPDTTLSIATADPIAVFKAELKAARDEVSGFALRGKIEPKGAVAESLAGIRTAANTELTTLEALVGALAQPAETDAREGIRNAWRIVGRYVELVLRLDRV